MAESGELRFFEKAVDVAGAAMRVNLDVERIRD
jgi:hypothetical protein